MRRERTEARRLEAETKRLEAEKEDRLTMKRLEVEEADKNRQFELEKSRIEVNSPHPGGGEGVAEKSVESQMVRSLKLIPEFDENKVTE